MRKTRAVRLGFGRLTGAGGARCRIIPQWVYHTEGFAHGIDVRQRGNSPGAWEAGARIGVAYPGTPSTETLEAFAKKDGVYAEWCVNEKVAVEVGIGRRSPARACCPR